MSNYNYPTAVKAEAVPQQAYVTGAHSFPISSEINEVPIRDFLNSHAWPNGLQDALVKGITKMPIRFFICDDSGSMATCDGSKLEKIGPGEK